MTAFVPCFPPSLPPHPPFPIGWVLQVHNLIKGLRLLIRVLSGVSQVSSQAILLSPRWLSRSDKVIFFKVFIKQRVPGGKRMPGLPNVSSGASLGMSSLIIWFDQSCAGYSCNVYDKKLHIYFSIYTEHAFLGKVHLEGK